MTGLWRSIAIVALAYVIALQGMAVGVAQAHALGKTFDARSGFDPMMSLCLPGTVSDSGKQNGPTGDEHHRGLCCVLGKTVALAALSWAVVAILGPAATQVIALHPPRHVIALAVGPPKTPEPRGPPTVV